MSIRDKLSQLVPSQLPEFIKEEYPQFVAFLQAYYRFLEQDQNPQELLQNIRSYNDIDRTVDSFIQFFKKNYLTQLPSNVLSDPALLVKNIKDLYSNKGNERSFTVLLGMLLNKKVEFYYPGRSILIASDGKWVQQVSIFVRVLTGNPSDIVGQRVNIISQDQILDTTFIKEKKEVLETIEGVESISTTAFELVIDNTTNPTINIGNFIESGTFRGEVIATTTLVNVLDGGTNFRVGQTFTLISGDGRRSVIRIAEIGTAGTITKIEFIRFGIGYESNFLFSFAPGAEQVNASVFFISGDTLFTSDIQEGFTDRGFVNRYNFTSSESPYCDLSYCGDVLRTFFNDTRESTGAVGDTATVEVRLGSKAKYPGYFATNEGFLSDDVKLQDRDFYQPYSYVLELDEQLKKYKQAVLDILHPAGTKLFGNYVITNEISNSLAGELTVETL